MIKNCSYAYIQTKSEIIDSLEYYADGIGEDSIIIWATNLFETIGEKALELIPELKSIPNIMEIDIILFLYKG